MELTEQIAAKGAIRDYMTAPELAKATARSRRWVTGKVRSIPGARMVQNRFVFPKSELLSEWMHQQRRIRELERRMFSGNTRIPHSTIATLTVETLRYERIVLRELSRFPLREWPDEARRDFENDLGHMLHEVQRAAGMIE